MLRGVGLNQKELDILGIRHAGEIASPNRLNLGQSQT